MAELLNPSVSGVDMARVITLSRGYIRPIPKPADIQPAIATAAGQLRTVVTKARTTAPSTITDPIFMALTLLSLPPIRPWTAEAPAHASAPPVRVSPANVGEKEYRSTSRYGR